jgi:hypothetical protein
VHFNPIQQTEDWRAGGECAHHVGDDDHGVDYNRKGVERFSC